MNELIQALRLARKSCCAYMGDTCDCKFGASGTGEQTGCPELYALIDELEGKGDGPLKASGFVRNELLEEGRREDDDALIAHLQALPIERTERILTHLVEHTVPMAKLGSLQEQLTQAQARIDSMQSAHDLSWKNGGRDLSEYISRSDALRGGYVAAEALRLLEEKDVRIRELEQESNDYRDGAKAEARRCDELLAERNRSRNETLAARERIAELESGVRNEYQDRTHASTGKVTREHREAAFATTDLKGDPLNDRIAQLLAAREATAYQRGREEAQARLERLPDRFSLSAFVFAGLPLEAASKALLVSRRILEDNENGPVSAQGGWVAVDERLPDDSFTRLVAAGFRTVAYYENGIWWRIGSLDKAEELRNVTHWRPLPDPPPPSDPSKGGE